MQKIYRILRDNKELGPLSLEELLELKLKKYDLIWIEGRSAGWRYPSEIEALKPYLDDQVPQNSHPASHSLRPEAAVPVLENTNKAPVASDEIELTPEQLEKKANEIYQRIQAFNENNEKQKEETQTKYARSLEDLKQEYADWLHKKKVKKGFKVNKKLLAGFSVTAVILLAWVFISGRSKSDLLNAQTKQYISNAVYSQQQPQESIPKIKDQHNSSQVETADIPKSPGPKKELSVDQFIDSVERALAKSDASVKKKSQAYKNFPLTNKPEKKVDEAPVLKVAPADINTVPLSQLISMNAHYMYDTDQHLFGLEITIQNKSRQLLKKVTVDVFYYKKGDRLFDKETLYFTNIQPGNSFTLSTPGNKKAVAAKFQLGQVIGDN
jgi:hypothetical protein